MPKLHLLFKKEELDEEKVSENKIAVVFDILLATSTITSCLYYGATEVIPVLNGEEAKQRTRRINDGSYLLVGEFEGKTIDGFLDPNPLRLKHTVAGKKVILSTTNGTVAIRKAAGANKVFISSILNGEAVASHVRKVVQDETLLLICSGSSNEFCLEDLFGAGYFLHCFLKGEAADGWELTDSALAAIRFYRGVVEQGEDVLQASRVGRMLMKYGFEDELRFVAKPNALPIVPMLDGDRVVSLTQIYCNETRS